METGNGMENVRERSKHDTFLAEGGGSHVVG